MKFSEALNASFNNKFVKSCTNKIYSPFNLKVKKISNEVFISDSVTTEKERKGNWAVLDI